MSERVQKLMSRAGLGSRRENEALIAAGRVTVNGKVIRLGDKADPYKDRIKVNGKILKFSERIYIKLYKPKGVISSTEDELKSGRKTVRDLVDLPGFLYPVGRLDKQSEGLMLLTNDGRLTHRLTHPRYQHSKVYLVDVEGTVSPNAQNLWRRGVILDGRMTAPAKIEIVNRNANSTQLRITLREGRKRQIRRIAASLGHPVTRLLRKEIGPIKLGSLRAGEWTPLSPREISDVQRDVYDEKK
jgi:23S rRNA pseudouridine2605 synthase